MTEYVYEHTTVVLEFKCRAISTIVVDPDSIVRRGPGVGGGGGGKGKGE